MNEPEIVEAEKPAARSSLLGVFRLGCLSVVFIFVVFFIGSIGGFGFIEAPCYLVFGWIGFLERTLPKISWNWDIAGMGLVCVALILFLAHRFLDWLTGNIANRRGKSWRWPWKWTWCGLSAVMIFFLVGMSVGGMVHQIGWIVSSPEPWFEIKGGSYKERYEMRMIGMTFRTTLAEAKGDPAALRSKIWSFEKENFGERANPSWLEDYQMFFVLKADQKVAGLIAFPRDPQKCSKTGALYVFGDNEDFVKPGNIRELIQTNRQNLLSF
jgi:hypothetical protein